MVVQIIHKDRVRTREFYVSTIVEHPSVWRITPDEPLTWGHAVRGGVGCAYGVTQLIAIPDDSCEFRAFIGLKDGCNLMDGVTFSVFVLDGEEHLVASEHSSQRDWKQISADLSAFRGRTIRLKLAADGGPGDDAGADWASWGICANLESAGALSGPQLTPTYGRHREVGWGPQAQNDPQSGCERPANIVKLAHMASWGEPRIVLTHPVTRIEVGHCPQASRKKESAASIANTSHKL